MRKKKIAHYLLITLAVILGVLVFLSITGTVAHAAGLVDNTVSDANAYSKYPLENYQLDFYVDSSWDWLPWNWLDGSNCEYEFYRFVCGNGNEVLKGNYYYIIFTYFPHSSECW